MTNNRGFTLMELLIALTAGVLVVGVTMGIYRHIVQGEAALSVRGWETFRRMQVTHFLNYVLLYRSGPVYGTEERLAMISDLNLLGYGRELIYLAWVEKEKSPFLGLRIVPLVFADASSDAQAIKNLYQDPDMSCPYSCEEEIKGFAPEFFYRYAGSAVERLSGEEPEYVKIVLHQGDHEWTVVQAWQ